MVFTTRLVRFLKLGVGISSTELEYADSTSRAIPPAAGWQTNAPKWIQGHYIWQRTHIIYTDGREVYTNPVCVTGSKGDAGQDAISVQLSMSSITHKYSTESATYLITAEAYKGNSLVDFDSQLRFSKEMLIGVTAERTKANMIETIKVTVYPRVEANLDMYYTITVGGVDYVRTIPIKTVKDGSEGKKGETGATLRGPQSWSDLGEGYSFEAGGEGDEWKDVVIYGSNYYSCINNHVKTADNYPGSTEDVNNKYWQASKPMEIVATKILLAKFLQVDNLGAGAITMKDDDGNVVFRAEKGEVECEKGTFRNVSGFKSQYNERCMSVSKDYCRVEYYIDTSFGSLYRARQLDAGIDCQVNVLSKLMRLRLAGLPTSKNDASEGCVYVENGILKLKS